MKFYKILHLLLIGCSVLIYLIGIRAFSLVGNYLLCAVLGYGLLSGFYFYIAVLLSEKNLSRLRYYFNKSGTANDTLPSYDQLLQENTALTAELASVRQSYRNINDYAVSMVTEWDNYQNAYLILEQIRYRAPVEISNN